jgi:chemotaxis response regulator CheB
MIRVGLVDDQPLIRAGFGAVLAHVPDVTAVWEAADGERPWPWPPAPRPT